MMCPTFIELFVGAFFERPRANTVRPFEIESYLLASSIATATVTVISTMGLLLNLLF